MQSELMEFYKARWNVVESRLDTSQIDKTRICDDVEKLHEGMFVLLGEAPAKEEARTGRPFQGKAGENLNELIELSKFKREENFFVCNAFPFRCFKMGKTGEINRNPNAAELKVGADLLRQEIEIIKPVRIIVLGGSALKAMKHLGLNGLKIGSSGTFHKIPVNVVNHPSPRMYNQKKCRLALQEFFQSLCA